MFVVLINFVLFVTMTEFTDDPYISWPVSLLQLRTLEAHATLQKPILRPRPLILAETEDLQKIWPQKRDNYLVANGTCFDAMFATQVTI